jgi:hypothetical protein
MTDLKNLHFRPSFRGNNLIKFNFAFGEIDNLTLYKLTWNQFIELLKERDEKFLEVFTATLKCSTTKLKSAYFWECSPVSQTTLNKPFEFVVIKSESLNSQVQDPYKYKGFINDNSNAHVFNFTSFSGTNLIIPAPWFSSQEKSISGSVKWEESLEIRDYGNISRFTENAPLEQQREFWGKVAEELNKSLETNSAPQWLSTHGLGASYLHVRICKTPMYYQHKEYTEYKEIKKEGLRENNELKDSKGGNLFKAGVCVCVVVFLLAFSLFILIPSKKKKKNNPILLKN